jgi:hypothetical protein
LVCNSRRDDQSDRDQRQHYNEAINADQTRSAAGRAGSARTRAFVLVAAGAFAAGIVNYRITNAWFAVPVLPAITAPNTVPPTDQSTGGGQHGQHGRK